MMIWIGIHIMIDMCALRKILTYLSFPTDICLAVLFITWFRGVALSATERKLRRMMKER